MKRLKIEFICICLIFCTANFAYSAPPVKAQKNQKTKIPVVQMDGPILAGCESGLYTINENGQNNFSFTQIWGGGSVKKILKNQNGWFFLTSQGIIFSNDLITFETRNEGLPFNIIKKIHIDEKNTEEKQFEKAQKELKDIAVHPENPDIMVTATKDSVYLSYDAGLTWKSIGLNARTSGVKCLAVFDEPSFSATGEQDGSDLIVCISHSIYGFSYFEPESEKPSWIDMESGFINLPNQKLTEELASMLLVKNEDENSPEKYELYMGTSYLPRIYKLDWAAKSVEVIWQEGLKNSTQDSLVKVDDSLVYLGTEGFKAIDIQSGMAVELPLQIETWKEYIDISDDMISLYVPETYGKNWSVPAVSLTELWMLKDRKTLNKYYDKTKTVKGLYIPANQAADERLNGHIKTIKENKLNAIVVDMKDDAGLLRFDAKNPIVKKYGTQSQYSVKLDDFVAKMKAEDIYLVARIVVFKDKNLYYYGGKKFAVWDKRNDKAWRGTRKGSVEIKDEDGNVIGTEPDYYDEFWVDPYCEEVWKYNVAIAQELIERGFDEIQFDYIRFPTDGLNLWDAKYRYYEHSMDKESALISFLSYARENINCPIGIDIYGSNGWYRSSARTGQDVELMSKYVDVICPMFYPSHFEQNFLDYVPREERPYRIYNFGSYRNNIIGRNKIVVRPWIQAFFLRVSYDVRYYGKDYIKREIFGVRDSTNDGYLYWNNVGRYDDICSDIGDEMPYPWMPVEKNKDAAVESASSILSSDEGKIAE